MVELKRTPTRIGMFIEQTRKSQGMSQASLAKQCGQRQSVIMRIESGETARPNQKTIEAIAGALRVDTLMLMKLAHGDGEDVAEFPSSPVLKIGYAMRKESLPLVLAQHPRFNAEADDMPVKFAHRYMATGKNPAGTADTIAPVFDRDSSHSDAKRIAEVELPRLLFAELLDAVVLDHILARDLVNSAGIKLGELALFHSPPMATGASAQTRMDFGSMAWMFLSKSGPSKWGKSRPVTLLVEAFNRISKTWKSDPDLERLAGLLFEFGENARKGPAETVSPADRTIMAYCDAIFSEGNPGALTSDKAKRDFMSQQLKAFAFDPRLTPDWWSQVSSSS